ncbi:MAG: hypothetical protein JXM69_14285 [Anaerolineae bacterium]|nr:hypothetical protein [Anaerolineae bacterium]
MNGDVELNPNSTYGARCGDDLILTDGEKVIFLPIMTIEEILSTYGNMNEGLLLALEEPDEKG